MTPMDSRSSKKINSLERSLRKGLRSRFKFSVEQILSNSRLRLLKIQLFSRKNFLLDSHSTEVFFFEFYTVNNHRLLF